MVDAGKPSRPILTGLLLLGVDLTALALALQIGIFVASWLGAKELQHYVPFWPLLLVFPVAYAKFGLYPGVGTGPAEEFRRLTLASTCIFLALGAAAASLNEPGLNARYVVTIAWVVALAGVPVGRWAMRVLFSKEPWWGYRVAILGAGNTAQLLVQALQRHPSIGLRPTLAFDDDPLKRGDISGVPVCGPIHLAERIAKENGIHYAIVAMPSVEGPNLLGLLERHSETFRHLLVIPDPVGMASLGVAARDVAGILGIEIRQRLLMVGPRIAKRVLDLFFVGLGGLCLLPLIALIVLAIKLESRGPLFYGNPRVGHGGRRFKMWKFRSMVKNADQILPRYLEKNPAAKKEWDETQKLKNDPRITRVGKLLRKTSLDELPQLFNVLSGEMTLVGPRPLPPGEVPLYGELITLYSRVRPGITGLWQVSGRNDLAYQERVKLNTYYVRNWSVWLDIYILARTLPVVVAGRGAR